MAKHFKLSTQQILTVVLLKCCIQPYTIHITKQCYFHYQLIFRKKILLTYMSKICQSLIHQSSILFFLRPPAYTPIFQFYVAYAGGRKEKMFSKAFQQSSTGLSGLFSKRSIHKCIGAKHDSDKGTFPEGWGGGIIIKAFFIAQAACFGNGFYPYMSKDNICIPV